MERVIPMQYGCHGNNGIDFKVSASDSQYPDEGVDLHTGSQLQSSSAPHLTPVQVHLP